MEKIGYCLGVFFVLCLILFLGPFVFQLLWNNIVTLFWTTAPILNYWQSFGIILLINIIVSIIRAIFR